MWRIGGGDLVVLSEFSEKAKYASSDCVIFAEVTASPLCCGMFGELELGAIEVLVTLAGPTMSRESLFLK